MKRNAIHQFFFLTSISWFLSIQCRTSHSIEKSHKSGEISQHHHKDQRFYLDFSTLKFQEMLQLWLLIQGVLSGSQTSFSLQNYFHHQSLYLVPWSIKGKILALTKFNFDAYNIELQSLLLAVFLLLVYQSLLLHPVSPHYVYPKNIPHRLSYTSGLPPEIQANLV